MSDSQSWALVSGRVKSEEAARSTVFARRSQFVIGNAFGDREIGLGVVNPRTDEAETPESIMKRCDEALEFWQPDQILLNPDCGFGCFANRCVNVEEVAAAKLRSMVEASRRQRERTG